MTTHRITFGLLTVLLAASACGDDQDMAATVTNAAVPATTTVRATATPSTDLALEDPIGSYCRNVIEWQVAQMDPYDGSDPAQLEAFITADAAFHHRALELAPAELKADWQLSSDTFDDTVVRLLEKYGYSMQRVQAEATPEEHALADQPPPDVRAAQARIHAYEARVCLSEQPGPADVAFDGPADADYCASAVALDELLDFSATAFSPESVEQVLTSQMFRDALAASVEAAPESIVGDVAAVAAFDLEVKAALVERYDYDFRRLFLEATPAELAITNSLDPAVTDAYRRVVAYEEQWCGA
jgi:hypothetical protein